MANPAQRSEPDRAVDHERHPKPGPVGRCLRPGDLVKMWDCPPGQDERMFEKAEVVEVCEHGIFARWRYSGEYDGQLCGAVWDQIELNAAHPMTSRPPAVDPQHRAQAPTGSGWTDRTLRAIALLAQASAEIHGIGEDLELGDPADEAYGVARDRIQQASDYLGTMLSEGVWHTAAARSEAA